MSVAHIAQSVPNPVAGLTPGPERHPATGPGETVGATTDPHRWLVAHHEGRLGCLTGRGWRSIPVRYVVAGSSILTELPTFHDLTHYAPGRSVTFTVSGSERSGRDRTVVVHGTPRIVDPGELRRPPGFEQQWPKSLPVKILAIPISTLSNEGERHASQNR